MATWLERGKVSEASANMPGSSSCWSLSMNPSTRRVRVVPLRAGAVRSSCVLKTWPGSSRTVISMGTPCLATAASDCGTSTNARILLRLVTRNTGRMLSVRSATTSAPASRLRSVISPSKGATMRASSFCAASRRPSAFAAARSACAAARLAESLFSLAAASSMACWLMARASPTLRRRASVALARSSRACARSILACATSTADWFCSICRSRMGVWISTSTWLAFTASPRSACSGPR